MFWQAFECRVYLVDTAAVEKLCGGEGVDDRVEAGVERKQDEAEVSLHSSWHMDGGEGQQGQEGDGDGGDEV